MLGLNAKRWLQLGATLCALTAAAATAAPPPAEVFFKPSDVGEAHLALGTLAGGDHAPEGPGAPRPRGGGPEPGGKSKQIAQFNDADIGNVHWRDDGRLLFSSSDLADGSGLRRAAWGLFGIDIEGKRIRQYVKRQGGLAPSEGLFAEMLQWNHTLATVPHPQADGPNEDVLLAEMVLDDTGLRLPVRLNTRTGVSRAAGFTCPNCVGWISDSNADARVAFTRAEGRPRRLLARARQQRMDQALRRHIAQAALRDRRRGRRGRALRGRASWARGLSGADPLRLQDPRAGAQGPDRTPGYDVDAELIVQPGGKLLGVRATVDGETTVWFDAKMKAFKPPWTRDSPAASIASSAGAAARRT